MIELLVAAGVLGLAYALLRRQNAPGPEPKPAEPGPEKAPPAPALGPTKFDSAPRYLTKPSDVAAPATWAKVGSLAFALLTDSHTGGFAQLDYEGAQEQAKRVGARLATFDEIVAYSDAARAAGTEIPPFTLPDDGMLKAAGIVPSAYPTRKEHDAAVNAYRDANMASEAWARYHDQAVQQKLKALGWDESKPAGNAGKWWEGGAPPGRSWLKGWRRKDGSWIQQGVSPADVAAAAEKGQPPPQGPHNSKHFDYGTRTLVVRDAAVA